MYVNSDYPPLQFHKQKLLHYMNLYTLYTNKLTTTVA